MPTESGRLPRSRLPGKRLARARERRVRVRGTSVERVAHAQLSQQAVGVALHAIEGAIIRRRRPSGRGGAPRVRARPCRPSGAAVQIAERGAHRGAATGQRGVAGERRADAKPGSRCKEQKQRAPRRHRWRSRCARPHAALTAAADHACARGLLAEARWRLGPGPLPERVLEDGKWEPHSTVRVQLSAQRVRFARSARENGAALRCASSAPCRSSGHARTTRRGQGKQGDRV